MLQDVVLASIVAVPIVGVLASHAVSPRAPEQSFVGSNRWMMNEQPSPDPRVQAPAASWYPPAVNLAVYVSTGEPGQPEVITGTVLAPADDPRPLAVHAERAHARVITSAYELASGSATANDGILEGEPVSLDVIA